MRSLHLNHKGKRWEELGVLARETPEKRAREIDANVVRHRGRRTDEGRLGQEELRQALRVPTGSRALQGGHVTPRAVRPQAALRRDRGHWARVLKGNQKHTPLSRR